MLSPSPLTCPSASCVLGNGGSADGRGPWPEMGCGGSICASTNTRGRGNHDPRSLLQRTWCPSSRASRRDTACEQASWFDQWPPPEAQINGVTLLPCSSKFADSWPWVGYGGSETLLLTARGFCEGRVVGHTVCMVRRLPRSANSQAVWSFSSRSLVRSNGPQCILVSV